MMYVKTNQGRAVSSSLCASQEDKTGEEEGAQTKTDAASKKDGKKAHLVLVEDLLEEPHDGALPRRQLRCRHVPERQVAGLFGF
jgi:hypothetical protein